MNRVHTYAFCLFVLCFCFAAGAVGQTPTPSPSPETKPANPDGGNPFAPQPAPPLPAGMTGSDANDPRFKLTPGMYDAGETSMGIRHLTLFKKPDAFQLGSDNPDDPKVDKALGQLGIGDSSKIPKPLKLVLAGLPFANSDMAFQGKHLFQGNFYGVNIFDISDPAKARLVTSMVCPGGQGDLSVYKNLMFMSVEMPNGRVDCGTQGFPAEPPPAAGQQRPHLPAAQKDRFRGVRIFDITDITKPKQVAAVQTCRGSHTHTLVVDPNDKNNVYIYVSGTSFVRQNEELAGCSGEAPEKDPNTALFRIEVIKVPVTAPQNAKVVSSPRVFMDPRTGVINALTNGGSHGQDKPAATDQCHDITVYSAIGLAAGACSGNGILLDIKDPANPKRVDAVNDPNYAYWHSASFSNDGKKVVFTDEWGGGLGALPSERSEQMGRRFDLPLAGKQADVCQLLQVVCCSRRQRELRGAQRVAHSRPRPRHRGPGVVPGRHLGYGFHRCRAPDGDRLFRSRPDRSKDARSRRLVVRLLVQRPDLLVRDRRGLDIFELTPTKNLTQNEIDAAKLVQVAELNVQNQEKIEWPRQLVVAKAYIDQLERSQALAADQIANLRQAIQKAEGNQKELGKLKSLAPSLEKSAGLSKSAADSARLQALADILRRPAL